MKTVMYVLTSLAHKRAFESFEERDDLNQIVVGPKAKVTGSGIVPEDYSDFKIKTIKYFVSPVEIQAYVNKYKPDVYVQASLPCASGINLPDGCKKVYVSHGMVGNHVKGIIKKAGFDTSVWKGCDLYCGATEVFADWIRHVAKVGDDKILLNAIPQLDILHNKQYYRSYRQRVLDKTSFPKAKKVLLYVGFCCKDRFDFNPHNEDYFKTAIELEKIAKANDWLVMIKPRQTYNVMMKFLHSHKWGKKYVNDYARIQSSKHLHFITTTGHIYRYFFADAFVLNGTSTVEVEACAIGKPLFIVHTKNSIDPYGMISDSAAVAVSDLSKLKESIETCFDFGGEAYWSNNQTSKIKKMGLTLDGQMHKRIQDKIARM